MHELGFDDLRQIGTPGRAFYTSPAYAARVGLPAHPDELKRHRLVANSAGTKLNHRPFVVEGRAQTLPIEGFWRTNDTGTAASMVLQGLGIGRLATIAVQPLVRPGKLASALAGFIEAQPVPVCAVLSGARQRLPKIRACIDHWAAWFGRIGPAAAA